MSSIMRRRRGLISAIGKLLSEGLGFENPQSSQTGACYGDLSSIAAPAASFNLQRSRAFKDLVLFDHLVGAKQERPGDVQAERLGGLEVDGEVELDPLDDLQLRRCAPLAYGTR